MNYDKYFNTKPDYLTAFNDPDFGKIYDEHKSLFYLKDITESMLKNISYTQDQFNNFKSWVFMYGHTLREKEEKKIADKSNELKMFMLDNFDAKFKVTYRYDSIVGTLTKENIFKLKSGNQGTFLMPPKAKTKGYNINNITIIDAQII